MKKSQINVATVSANTCTLNKFNLSGKKVDHRVTYRICLDTETFNYEGGLKFGTLSARPDFWQKMSTGVGPTHPIVFNVGFAVFDAKGNIYERFSFLLGDTGAMTYRDGVAGLNYDVLMDGGFFTEAKIKKMEDGWLNHEFGVVSWARFQRILWGVVKAYNIKDLYAHNAAFDYKGLSNTYYAMTGDPNTDAWLPEGMRVVDTLKMSKVVTDRKSYRDWCFANNTTVIKVVDGVEKSVNTLVTNHKSPRPRATAEVLFRHLTRDMTFVEDHTALADVEIEAQLAVWFLRQHKKMGDIYIARKSR